MNKKHLLLFSFFLPLLILMIWTAALYVQRQSGQEVRVRITGYDPRDLLAGHYIQYQIDWEKTDCSQFKGSVCPKQDFCKEARWGVQCRFYVPEKHSRQLDDLFRHRNSTQDVFEVVYAYQPGRQAIAKQLLINGADWKEYPTTLKTLRTEQVKNEENNIR